MHTFLSINKLKLDNMETGINYKKMMFNFNGIFHNYSNVNYEVKEIMWNFSR